MKMSDVGQTNSYSPDLPTDFVCETEEDCELLTALSYVYVNKRITNTAINSCKSHLNFALLKVDGFRSCQCFCILKVVQ